MAELFANTDNDVLRAAALSTMLRVTGPVFDSVVATGLSSEHETLRNVAIECKIMRANGFVVKATGRPMLENSMPPAYAALVIGFSAPLSVVHRDYGRSCITTLGNPGEQGCNAKYNVTIRNGTVSVRNDRWFAFFEYVDGEFIGTVSPFVANGNYDAPGVLEIR